MPLFRRKPPRLPLRMPRIDGSSWPDRRDVERRSFAALTLYEMGYREAFEPEAATIASKKEPVPLVQPRCNPPATTERGHSYSRSFDSFRGAEGGV